MKHDSASFLSFLYRHTQAYVCLFVTFQILLAVKHARPAMLAGIQTPFWRRTAVAISSINCGCQVLVVVVKIVNQRHEWAPRSTDLAAFALSIIEQFDSAFRDQVFLMAARHYHLSCFESQIITRIPNLTLG